MTLSYLKLEDKKMPIIKAPENYINEPDIIKKAGEYIKKYGRNALVTGSKTALKASAGSR